MCTLCKNVQCCHHILSTASSRVLDITLDKVGISKDPISQGQYIYYTFCVSRFSMALKDKFQS